MGQCVGTPPVFLSSFSFQAWHRQKDLNGAGSFGSGRKKMNPPLPLPHPVGLFEMSLVTSSAPVAERQITEWKVQNLRVYTV